MEEFKAEKLNLTISLVESVFSKLQLRPVFDDVDIEQVQHLFRKLDDIGCESGVSDLHFDRLFRLQLTMQRFSEDRGFPVLMTEQAQNSTSNG